MSQFPLRGNIEGDAHAVRKTWVSNKNEAEYGEELKAARQRCKHKNPAAWVLHLRIAGMKERGGRIIIKKLPNKLVMPGGRPPVESYKELQQTEFLNQVAPKSCLFADGAHSWKKYISGAKAKHKLSYRFVTHNRLQFTKKVRKAQKSTSSVAGTQTIDRVWQSLNKYVPATVKSRRNTMLWDYVHSWAWRHNIIMCEGGSPNWFNKLGEACRQGR